ncbi:hypothetical protein [Streptomyces sp. G45]|uniref:hypothetical protein n=1 Tax=Streptomyces sp. G45 TaxID=3406627 RepID=UPI003C23BD03
MTQQRTGGTSAADAAVAYVAALAERLAADGCHVAAATWRDHDVVVGSRSDRKARWFGTRSELFVCASAVPEVDQPTLAAFTGWALEHAKGLRGGLPGARNAAMVLPALVSDDVRQSAAAWAAQDARVLAATVIGRPVTVDTSEPGRTRVALYRGRARYGGMFTGHVLEKASLYFP